MSKHNKRKSIHRFGRDNNATHNLQHTNTLNGWYLNRPDIQGVAAILQTIQEVGKPLTIRDLVRKTQNALKSRQCIGINAKFDAVTAICGDLVTHKVLTTDRFSYMLAKGCEASVVAILNQAEKERERLIKTTQNARKHGAEGNVKLHDTKGSTMARYYLVNGDVTEFGRGRPGADKLCNECDLKGNLLPNRPSPESLVKAKPVAVKVDKAEAPAIDGRMDEILARLRHLTPDFVMPEAKSEAPVLTVIEGGNSEAPTSSENVDPVDIEDRAGPPVVEAQKAPQAPAKGNKGGQGGKKGNKGKVTEPIALKDIPEDSDEFDNAMADVLRETPEEYRNVTTDLD